MFIEQHGSQRFHSSLYQHLLTLPMHLLGPHFIEWYWVLWSALWLGHIAAPSTVCHLHFTFLLTSLTLSCSRCSYYLCVQDLSHSLSLRWFEILPGVSTIFVFRISLCVLDFSSASLLYILVVFSVLSVISLVVVPSSGYTDQRREILTHPMCSIRNRLWNRAITEWLQPMIIKQRPKQKSEKKTIHSMLFHLAAVIGGGSWVNE